MPRIIPIRDLRNTTEISELAHREQEPVFITKNGYSDLVVMSSELYDKIVRTNRIDFAIYQSEKEAEEGADLTETDAASDRLDKNSKEFIRMKKSINVTGAPAAVGPYVHAVEANGMIFVSGQLGLDPDSGKLKAGIAAQTRQSLENLKTILEGCGSDLDHVVKTSIFLDDINDFAEVNEVYAQYFVKELPARSCVAVDQLPKGGLVEIEAIAVKA